MIHEFIAGDVTAPPPGVLNRRRRPRLVLGSPPYTKRRAYGTTGMMRDAFAWVEFMLTATDQMLALADGPVIWVCNGCMVRGKYQAAVEGLIWELFRQGRRVEHPLIWSKNAAPNRRDWWCNGWEYVVAVLPPAFDRVWNWEAIATPQKYKNGGRFRQRGVDGSRRLGRAYVRNALARPYDIIRATVGGGRMGHPIASEHEAPYPVSLVRPIIAALTNPGDLVLDPFAGSCTTMQACFELGRDSLMMDLRENQRTYHERRLRSLEEAARG